MKAKAIMAHKEIIASLIVIGFAISFYSGIVLATTPGPSFVTTIQNGSMVEGASYIIFQNNGNIYARNGTTGAIDYEGSDAWTVIQEAVNQANGREVSVRAGIYNLINDITVPAGGLDLQGENFAVPPAGGWIAPTAGTVLNVITAARDCIYVPQQIQTFTINDISISFPSSLASTGDGIDLASQVWLSGTSPTTLAGLVMVQGFSMSNVYVYDVDANHYCYFLGNVLDGTMSGMYGYGGGFIWFYQYTPAGSTYGLNSGNTEMYGYFQFSASSTSAQTLMKYSVLDQRSIQPYPSHLNYIGLDGILDIYLPNSPTYAVINMSSNTLSCHIDKIMMADLNGKNCVINIGGSASNYVMPDINFPTTVSLPYGSGFYQIPGYVVLQNAQSGGGVPTINTSNNQALTIAAPLILGSWVSLNDQLINYGITLGATTAYPAWPHSTTDLSYGVLVCPSWATSVGVAIKGTSSVELVFGTAAPSGATIDMFMLR